MPVDKITYRKDQGVVYLEIEIINVPSWSYRYVEDMPHENSTSEDDPKRHTLGLPHELKRPLHEWIFVLSNTAHFKIHNVTVKMDWYQEQNGQKIKIHEWHPDPIDIGPESGEVLEDRARLNPL